LSHPEGCIGASELLVCGLLVVKPLMHVPLMFVTPYATRTPLSAVFAPLMTLLHAGRLGVSI